MADLHAFYWGSDKQAKGLMRWNGGEGTVLLNTCKKLPRRAPNRGGALCERIAAVGSAEWGGTRGMTFHADGKLTTPWGSGKWGDASTDGKSTVFAEFFGVMHLLTFNGDTFDSTRCSDGQEVKGRLLPIGS